jgi:hypothetical protein
MGSIRENRQGMILLQQVQTTHDDIIAKLPRVFIRIFLQAGKVGGTFEKKLMLGLAGELDSSAVSPERVGVKLGRGPGHRLPSVGAGPFAGALGKAFPASGVLQEHF